MRNPIKTASVSGISFSFSMAITFFKTFAIFLDVILPLVNTDLTIKFDFKAQGKFIEI